MLTDIYDPFGIDMSGESKNATGDIDGLMRNASYDYMGQMGM